MNRETVEGTLALNGINRNSQSWKDYNKAKKLILGENWTDKINDPERYELHIQYIVDYLGL